jgi:hypothetical protein
MSRSKVLISQTLAAALVLVLGMRQAAATEQYGIFERVLEATGSFADTTRELEAALARSELKLQGQRDLTYTDQQQAARVYVLTSPAYLRAAEHEAPNTVSAQILRLAVYEYGAGKATHIDIANPVAHAMVFYSGSPNYARLLAAARQAEQELRDVAAKVPGKSLQVQLEPMRSEKALNNFDGDGPAKMMAKWRNWSESQNVVFSAEPADFTTTVAKVEKALRSSRDKGVAEPSGWSLVSEIPLGANAVYFGISNQYTENKMVRINSDFRSGGKTRDAPYPGVDHAPALPLEVLVYNDGKHTQVVQYGEMWRMQLYFWDSGYLAFAKNTLIPSVIFGSIKNTVESAVAVSGH